MERGQARGGPNGAAGGEGTDAANEQEPAYAFKPSLLGSAATFMLGPDGIEWTRGGNAGTVPYRNVCHVRMSYKPASLQSHRFVTEVWAQGAPKLQIESTSWKGMAEIQRLDAAYGAFIAELHGRLARDGATVRYEQGINAFAYWPGLAIFFGTGLLLVGLLFRSLQAQTLGTTAFVVALFVLFFWQGGNFFRRNRPGQYRPDALPASLMPGGGR